jgi:hypothetical protein
VSIFICHTNLVRWIKFTTQTTRACSNTGLARAKQSQVDSRYRSYSNAKYRSKFVIRIKRYLDVVRKSQKRAEQTNRRRRSTNKWNKFYRAYMLRIYDRYSKRGQPIQYIHWYCHHRFRSITVGQNVCTRSAICMESKNSTFRGRSFCTHGFQRQDCYHFHLRRFRQL